MRLWLSVEWKKARRRRLWLPVAALVAMQGLWLAWAVRGMDMQEAAQGYLGCLYQLPMMNVARGGGSARQPPVRHGAPGRYVQAALYDAARLRPV